jgi:hypothetical protein
MTLSPFHFTAKHPFSIKVFLCIIAELDVARQNLFEKSKIGIPSG